MRSTPKYPLRVVTDDVYKDLYFSATIAGAPRDATVSYVLDHVHHDDTETLGEEGIDYRQRNQTPSLEDLLRLSSNMQCASEDFMIFTEATTEKANELVKNSLGRPFQGPGKLQNHSRSSSRCRSIDRVGPSSPWRGEDIWWRRGILKLPKLDAISWRPSSSSWEWNEHWPVKWPSLSKTAEKANEV